MKKNILIVALIVALVILLGIEIYQTKKINDLTNQSLKYQQADKNFQELTKNLTNMLASESAELITLKNKPSPTPEIVYKTQTQYVQEPDSNSQMNCTGGNYIGSVFQPIHCTAN